MLDPSRLKEFADDNFKFVGNVGEISKSVENAVKKKKLLSTSNFFFSTAYSKDLYCRPVKSRVCLGKG